MKERKKILQSQFVSVDEVATIYKYEPLYSITLLLCQWEKTFDMHKFTIQVK